MNDLDNVTLSEYADNPFIARLPRLVSQKDLYQQLNDPPTWSGQECHLPSFIRKHCIARLANCFFPQSRQVSLAERLGLLIRQGYVGRNPMTHAYIYHLQLLRMGVSGLLLIRAVGVLPNGLRSWCLLGKVETRRTEGGSRDLDRRDRALIRFSSIGG